MSTAGDRVVESVKIYRPGRYANANANDNANAKGGHDNCRGARCAIERSTTLSEVSFKAILARIDISN